MFIVLLSWQTECEEAVMTLVDPLPRAADIPRELLGSRLSSYQVV